jgi:hypothetical protein
LYSFEKAILLSSESGLSVSAEITLEVLTDSSGANLQGKLNTKANNVPDSCSQNHQYTERSRLRTKDVPLKSHKLHMRF